MGPSPNDEMVDELAHSSPAPRHPCPDGAVKLSNATYSPPEQAAPSAVEADVTTVSAVEVMEMLCKHLDRLARQSGDIPPTPPARLLHHDPVDQPIGPDGAVAEPVAMAVSDGSEMAATAVGATERRSHGRGDVEEHLVPWRDIQRALITRKFYSKRAPAISTAEYLQRMHRWCPMSTGVYLATSVYISRLAVAEGVIPVTCRNVHRLLLAGLRVAMKALEDLSYPHSRFAKVGGVSEAELARLEVTFCYLTNFELKVDLPTLQAEWDALQAAAVGDDLDRFHIVLPTRARKPEMLPLNPMPVPAAVEAPS